MPSALDYWISDRPPARLPGTPASHFQTPYFSELLGRYRQDPWWIVVGRSDEEILATWLVYTTPSDYLYAPRRRLTLLLDRRLHGVHGPVFAPLAEECLFEVRERLLRGVRDVFVRARAASVSLSLPPLLGVEGARAWAEPARERGFDVRPVATYVTETSAGEDAVFARLKGDRRTKIRKAERGGVKAEEVENLDDLRRYHEVRSATTIRNGFRPVPLQHFVDTWHVLRPHGIYHVFLAVQDDRVGAGQVAFRWNDYVYLSGVAVADWAIAEGVPANDLLQWEVLRWAARNDVTYVDFVGAQPGSSDSKAKAIDAFKARWGSGLRWSGEIVQQASRTRASLASAAVRILR